MSVLNDIQKDNRPDSQLEIYPIFPDKKSSVLLHLARRCLSSVGHKCCIILIAEAQYVPTAASKIASI